MQSINHIVISGRLGNEPTLKPVGETHKVVEFRLALSRSAPNGNGGFNDFTDWISCEVWDKAAETFARKLTKGAWLTVEGSLREQSWTTDDGQKRSRHVVRADRINSEAYFAANGDAPEKTEEKEVMATA